MYVILSKSFNFPSYCYMFVIFQLKVLGLVPADSLYTGAYFTSTWWQMKILNRTVDIVTKPSNGLPENQTSNPGEVIVVSHYHNDEADTGFQTNYPNPF